MSGLVIGGHFPFIVVEDVFTQRSHEHLVAGQLEIVAGDTIFVGLGGDQRRLVDQVPQIGPGEADRAGGDLFQVHVIVQRDVADMHLDDAHATCLGRPIDGHVPIESAGTQQRRIEHVGTIRGRQHDDRLVLLEAVHFAQDLVERLLAFVVTAAQTGAADPPHSVDLVDEQDAGGIFLGRAKQVADAAGADPDKHLNEFRAANRVEGHARLACGRPGQEGLAGPGRSHQQDTLGKLGAEPLKLGRVLQELHHLLKLVLRLFHGRHVVKGGLLLRGVEPLGGTADEAPQHAAPHRIGCAAHHIPEKRQQEQRAEHPEHHLRSHADAGFLGGDLDSLLGSLVEQRH